MQIKNILSRLSDPTRFGRKHDAVDSLARKAVEASTPPAASSPASPGRLREIVAEYDVSSISPKMYSELLQKLQRSGLLSDGDLLELSQIRAEMDRDGIGPDQRVDLLDIYAKKIKAAEQDASQLEEKLGAAGAKAFAASLRRRLDWLEKFAAVHASPEATAINALA